MVAPASKPYITPEEYLQRELKAEFKSEYWDGVIVAMSGGKKSMSVSLATSIMQSEPDFLERTVSRSRAVRACIFPRTIDKCILTFR